MNHSVLEICAGAGGQAAGLEHAAAIENDHDACNTLRTNRRAWEIIEVSVGGFSGKIYRGVERMQSVPEDCRQTLSNQLHEETPARRWHEIVVHSMRRRFIFTGITDQTVYDVE